MMSLISIEIMISVRMKIASGMAITCTDIVVIIFICSNISCKKVKIEITIGQQDNKAGINCTERCPFKINNT